MARISRTRVLDSHRSEVWHPSVIQLEMYHDAVRGMSATAIAAKRGVKRQTVDSILRRVEEYLWPIYADDIRGTKVRQTESLRVIFAEAMAAWEKSKAPAVEIRQRNAGGVRETLKVTRGQCGDPRFLDMAMRALGQIREIWGANAPIQVEHSGEIRVAGRSAEEARAQLLAQLGDVQQKLLAHNAN